MDRTRVRFFGEVTQKDDDERDRVQAIDRRRRNRLLASALAAAIVALGIKLVFF